MQTNVNWFEIATKDLTRATRFYETVFATKLRLEAFAENSLMAIFNRDDGQSIGCLTGDNWIEPSPQGTLIYLDAGPSIQAVIDRIEPAGGTIALAKMQLPKDLGYICQFIDTEGNRVALHAMN